MDQGEQSMAQWPSCSSNASCKPDKVIYFTQGCGNTMPDMSDLVPFHSGQVKNFYLLVLGQVQMYSVYRKLIQFPLSYFD